MTPTPTNATLKADAADAAHELATALSAATGQAIDQLKGYVEQYAADYAEVAAMVAAAKLGGDATALAIANDELRVLNDDALLDAATAGIQVETAGETTLLNVLNRFAGVLIARLLV